MAKPKDFARIEYFGTGPLTPGNDVRYAREQDNPLSDQFVPLEERDAISQARYWAKLSQKDERAAASEMDPPGKDTW